MASEGIEVRHRSACPAGERPPAGKCACQPSYRAVVRNRQGKVTRTFHRLADARAWRATALADVIRTPRLASKAPTVRAASEALLAGMRNASIRTRSGDPYKPSTIRCYRYMLDLYVLPALGDRRLDDVTLQDAQRITDRILAEGRSPSNAATAILPLRIIYRRAIRDGQVMTNPCALVELPAVRSRRDRIASPEEAARLLSVLPVRDRALWACAFYAGLRRGELRALTRESVNLASGLIHVSHGWDDREGRIEPKSRAGVRRVIIVAALRDALTEYLASADSGEFLFPVGPASIHRRAFAAWDAADPRLERIKLHDARHTCASLFIAAGVNAKALSEMLGHSSIAVTFDTYGHLMPGSWDEARGLVDAYLERALR